MFLLNGVARYDMDDSNGAGIGVQSAEQGLILVRMD